LDEEAARGGGVGVGRPPVVSPTDSFLSPVSSALATRVPAVKIHLILGSSSPYRRRALQAFGFPLVDMRSPDIDEKAISHADPVRLPLFVAMAKADAIVAELGAASRSHADERAADGEGEGVVWRLV
jgi:hypothetical protein